MSPDPSMESVVLKNPQSWNRYSYTINNPLRYIDPNGELWIESGDMNNPYSWVDECPMDMTCYDAIAAGVGDKLRIYGSYNQDDISNYDANQYGYFDIGEIANHHDSKFALKGGLNDTYLNLDTAADFFNLSFQYHSDKPWTQPLMVTQAGRADGSPVVGQQTHDLGRSVDVRYQNNYNIQSQFAIFQANRIETNALLNLATKNGFNQNYTGRLFTGKNAQYAPGHWDHIHIGKIRPPNN